MTTHARLPSRERRDAIIAAVRSTFAEKGFDRTTTRELARAAGVSEALLYKHFPSKESLHAAMLEACAASPEFAEFERALALPPSTAALVRLVHLLVSHFVLSDDPEKVTSCRLALRSLLEDGAFVRHGTERLAASWARQVDACVRAAARTGELDGPPAPGGLHGWFAHHLAVALMLHLLPPVPSVDYGLPRPALVAHAVRFVLRGMGLRNAAIRRHYHPDITPARRRPGARAG